MITDLITDVAHLLPFTFIGTTLMLLLVRDCYFAVRYSAVLNTDESLATKVRYLKAARPNKARSQSEVLKCSVMSLVIHLVAILIAIAATSE